jgi:hypothetical protein
MAIKYVGRKTSTKAGATSGNSTISLSSGLVGGLRGNVEDGDLVIATFSTGSSSDRTLAITDGTTDYTLIGSEIYANGVVDTNLRVAYKFMASTPDASVTFGPSGGTADAACTAVMVFSGVDPDTPLDVTVQTATLTSSILANPPSITPSTDGAVIVCIGAGSLAEVSFGSFSASGLSDFFSTSQNDTHASVLGAGHKLDWTSGAYDQSAFSYAFDSSNLSSAAMSLVLRPGPESTGGNLKVWNGSSWVAKPVKVWNGSSWVTKPVKRWNGSSWVTTTY